MGFAGCGLLHAVLRGCGVVWDIGAVAPPSEVWHGCFESRLDRWEFGWGFLVMMVRRLERVLQSLRWPLIGHGPHVQMV